MKLPAFLTADPKVLLKKLTKMCFYLLCAIAGLMFMKYEKDREAEKQREIDARKKEQAESQKMKEEVNWEDNLKVILPEQEELLTPNVLPHIMIPPLLNKIDVPEALVYERKKRYTAAYELRKTPAISFWSEPATAAGLDLAPSLSSDVPAIAPPIFEAPTPPRKPKPPKGIGQTYILLP